MFKLLIDFKNPESGKNDVPYLALFSPRFEVPVEGTDKPHPPQFTHQLKSQCPGTPLPDKQNPNEVRYISIYVPYRIETIQSNSMLRYGKLKGT